MKEFKFTIYLSDDDSASLDELVGLVNDRHPGRYTACSYLQEFLMSRLGGLLSDELDYERGLKNPAARRKFVVHTHGFKVSVELNDEQREKVTELDALYNEYSCYLLGRQVKYSFAGEVLLSRALDSALCNGSALDEQLEHDVQHWRDNVRRQKERTEGAYDGEAGDVPARNPSPDEAAPDEPEQEPETVSNAGKDASDGFDFFLSDSPFPEDAPEDSLPVSDHGGTEWKPISEIEEKREAAQGIYAGEPPEPQMEDRSDVYFRLLEGGDCLETPCTGDYGLSDCLAEPSEATLDFVDAFFVRS